MRGAASIGSRSSERHAVALGGRDEHELGHLAGEAEPAASRRERGGLLVVAVGLEPGEAAAAASARPGAVDGHWLSDLETGEVWTAGRRAGRGDEIVARPPADRWGRTPLEELPDRRPVLRYGLTP